MARERTISGEILGEDDDPVWEPLVAAVGGHRAGWFMWMCAIELVDKTKVHLYKHISTRRSLHLAEDGRAFAYMGEKQYREYDRDELVELVHLGWDPADDP